MREFLETQESERGPGTVGWWVNVLPQLTDEQRADLLEAAASDRISHRTIGVVLGKWGFEVTQAQVGHWRRQHVR